MSSIDTRKYQPEKAVEATTAIVVVPSTALATARRQAEGYRQHTKASETQRGYRNDWKRFQGWATANGVPALPATPEDVAAHVGWLADQGCSVATIERFLSAGRYYHRAVGLDFPRNATVVSETMKGIRRKVGVKPTKKAALGIEALVEVCGRLGADAIGVRNRAMLTVGWFCALRSVSLAGIRREHVRLVRVEAGEIDDYDRPSGLILHLPGSKTDQLKKGRDVAVHAQHDETVCPVLALLIYFRANQFASDDLIFPVSARTISRLIKRLAANPDHGHRSLREISTCEACDSVVRRFASHSLRRGAATTFASKGAPERDIMRQGGWVSEKVARGYMEEATLFQDNPTKDLTGKIEPSVTRLAPQKVQVRRRKRRRRRRRYAGRLV
jgi:integrase